MKNKGIFRRIPLPGLRTIKTVLAAMLTALLMRHVLHQNPFFGCIGAVVAVERTFHSSLRASVIRNVGTITGGCIGIAVSSFTESIPLLSLGLIPLIWINNKIGRQESIVPGAIVYFAVSYLNTMEQAWSYGLTRMACTFIGTIVGIAVNMLIFPPKESPVAASAGPG